MPFPSSPLPDQTFVYNKKPYTWSAPGQIWYCEGTSHEIGVDPTVYMYDSIDINTRRTIKTSEKLQDDYWAVIRNNRDQRIAEVEWRYNRYHRNERLGLPQQDSIADLDNYVQALADITNQENPFELTWPILGTSN